MNRHFGVFILFAALCCVGFAKECLPLLLEQASILAKLEAKDKLKAEISTVSVLRDTAGFMYRNGPKSERESHRWFTVGSPADFNPDMIPVWTGDGTNKHLRLTPKGRGILLEHLATNYGITNPSSTMLKTIVEYIEVQNRGVKLGSSSYSTHVDPLIRAEFERGDGSLHRYVAGALRNGQLESYVGGAGIPALETEYDHACADYRSRFLRNFPYSFGQYVHMVELLNNGLSKEGP